MVGDIEIVAIPAANMLYDLLDEKITAGTIAHLTKKRWGLKQRSFWFAGWQFDIFIQPDPLTMPVKRLDDVKAARELDLNFYGTERA